MAILRNLPAVRQSRYAVARSRSIDGYPSSGYVVLDGCYRPLAWHRTEADARNAVGELESVPADEPAEPVDAADRDWWAEQPSPDWWLDLDDARARVEDEEVAYFFRSRRHDRPSDLDQPWYRHLGESSGYRDRI